MRIGIDMLGVQSPASRGRGIGRYGRSLVAALLAVDAADEFLLYAHAGLPVAGLFPEAPHAEVRTLPAGRRAGEAIDRLAAENPDGLDALVLVSPFELHDDYDPPARPLNGPAMFAVLYDLIPFLFQEKYLTWAPTAGRFYRNLERLRGYDGLLAISEATRVDALGLLGLAGDRVVSISGASDPEFFTPGTPAAGLARLGIDRPFAFCLASADERKNLWGLLDAFRLLPEEVRAAHQLVVACSLTGAEARTIRDRAEGRGVGESLVLTGAIDDLALRDLYRGCAAFAFPSLYEGFGLPLLEAMHCGAPVLGGNNSSQVEVVGDAGLLANAQDARDIAEKLGRLLVDRPFAAELGRRGIERARRFRWEASAARAVSTIRRAEARPRKRRLRVDRPRIAIASPLPPKASGISDYAVRLAGELSGRYDVDLFHDEGYVPDLGRDGGRFALHDHRLFARLARTRNYRGIVYQMGNSFYHRFVFEMMKMHPGLVTLHDFCLAGFHYWYSLQAWADPDHFARKIDHFCPERAEELRPSLEDWAREDGGVPEACARRGLYLNRSVFQHARRVIVHSPWCLDQARALFPEHAGRTAVIPFGATARPVPAAQKGAIRARFGLPDDALIFGSFGIVHPSKMNVETLAAFEAVARARPDALLLFVGKALDHGEAADRAAGLGLCDRVRFLGRQSEADFADLIAATDVGVCLRRPPTNGETSAALLDLLRHGVASVVTDVATFADYPDDVVRKIPGSGAVIEPLARAMLDLAGRREALGAIALRHVRDHHGLANAADRYAEQIEADAEDRRAPIASRPPLAAGLRHRAAQGGS